MACECEGLQGLRLAICLAPPPGDYEFTLSVANKLSLVVNSRGAFLRASAVDDFLPFVRTQEVKVDEQALRALRVDVDRLVCGVVSALREAAEHWSQAAAEKLGRCKDLVERVEASCGAAGKRL